MLLVLCSALEACNGTDSIGGKRGDRDFRTVEPRLSNAEWKACCRRGEIRCDSGEDTLTQLVAAGEDCIDKALTAVEKHAKDDLAAAYYIRGQRKNDPVDFLRAWEAAEEELRRNPASEVALFNRALAQEKLGLTKEAIRSWNEVVKNDKSKWRDEAQQRRDHLQSLHDPEWRADKLEDALRRRDRATLAQLARALPFDAVLAFEESNLLDVEASRIFADVLGEPYTRSVVDAVERVKDRKALEEGLSAFRQARDAQRNADRDGAASAYERAATLLARAENPLFLAARYGAAAQRFSSTKESLALLDPIIPIVSNHGSSSLSARIHTIRANALEYDDRYLEAHEDYERALESAKNDPTGIVAALGRRSLNYATIGSSELAFADSFRAVSLLPYVADLNARHHAYASAAIAARQLGYPTVALHYQNALIEVMSRDVRNAPPGRLPTTKVHLAIALRARADIQVALERDQDALIDLEQAAGLAEAANQPDIPAQMQLRLNEMRGQALLNRDPQAAIAAFTKAIDLATKQDSTYRAVLYFKRAAARQKAGETNADEDIATALKILRDEAALLRNKSERGAFEELWTPYFRRFQSMHHQMVESRIARDDREGAFVYAEQARAFELMQLLLQSESAPAGFRKIETVSDLRQNLQTLPADTLILQYLVLEDKTYAWLLTRGKIELMPLRPGASEIRRWVTDANKAVRSGQNDPLTGAMRAAYGELFAAPLATPAARGRTRFVIIPDGPMHGLPFAGLQGTKGEGYLIRRGSIAVAGSTSLYLYAILRDRQLSSDRKLSVLVVGDPQTKRNPLPFAREEAEQLGRDYPGAVTLIGPEATTQRFLQAAKTATIVHFGGHGIASPQRPWSSMLLLTPDGADSGELTAQRLMTELSPLAHTRLVVLGACSTAPGNMVGPEGVAPLVRPLIAANIPAVVSTLWEVQDATAKNLLVSLHCHYRNGDDVAVALRHAQLEMLLRNVPATKWAAFQVVGHAGSPYARGVPMEKRHNEHVCSENSLHRPDGLHPQ